MLKIDTQRWHQSFEILREQALKSSHPPSRERCMGLYEIAKGKSATRVRQETGRNPQTVMEWVHRYIAYGPEALIYLLTGGHPPLCLLR